jgi:hypothetical protein
MTLDFFQIYYNEEQRSELYSIATPYKNEVLTDYFENDVIARAVPESNADYIGINSWRLRQKRYDGWVPVVLKGDLDLTIEKFERFKDIDVYNLTPRSSTHQMLANAAMWHGGPEHNYAWQNAIEELKTFIEIPVEVKHPIYENCQVVRGDLYKRYVYECLSPVMEFMRTREVFFADSGYAPKKLRDPKQVGVLEAYRAKTGRRDYPICPFILERLFSIWIDKLNLNIVPI